MPEDFSETSKSNLTHSTSKSLHALKKKKKKRQGRKIRENETKILFLSFNTFLNFNLF